MDDESMVRLLAERTLRSREICERCEAYSDA